MENHPANPQRRGRDAEKSAPMRRCASSFASFVLAVCAGAAALAAEKNTDNQLAAQSRLNAIVASADNPLSGASLTVRRGDTIVFDGAAGCARFKARVKRNGRQPCKRPLTRGAKMRMASISKMAAAFAAFDLAEEDLIDLDADVSNYLGAPLRNPRYPDRPITLRQILSHTSSIRDPEEYWVAAPGDFAALLGVPAIFADPVEGAASRAPGDYFTYANLNYGILAAALERASGRRFDLLVDEKVLAPLGLEAGFNWSGVSAGDRRKAAALYRREDGVWRAQTDDDVPTKSAAPVFLAADSVDKERFLEAYEPGQNPTLFSPQGGLRASTRDIAQLLSRLEEEGGGNFGVSPETRVWRLREDGANGDTDGGFFLEFGIGVQRLSPAQTGHAGVQMIGHPGEAYGLYSGAWLARDDDPETEDIAIAYAVTGASQPPAPGRASGFNAIEERLVDLAFEIIERDDAARAKSAAGTPAHDGDQDHQSTHDEPRPYDARRDANADVNAALARAESNGTRVLLVLGANWCHDSRGFAAYAQRPALARLIDEAFELVYVDVGQRDRNLDVGARFGAPELFGTPTILVLDADGRVLNRDTMHDWRTAASKPYEAVLAYFQGFAGGDDAR